jgi:16S rRNA (guanine966-N2)-methyltransferase
MRVIAGTARRLKLVTPEGMHTRPTSDKIKETLFNIIQADVYGAHFLDLFSGSGGIAIEALSRGAEYAVLVDSDRAALSCIKENIAHTGFTDKCSIIGKDVLRALEEIKKSASKPFDIIFMDPPYTKGYEEQVLSSLSDSRLVGEDTIIIVEAAVETDFDFASSLGYDIYRVKEYKNSKHVFMTYSS